MSAKRKALVLMVALGMLCAAGLRAAETEGDDFALRRDAPVYMGPYEEGDLEELTVADFGEFGTQPQAPQDQYRQYKKMLEHPSPGVQVPYRLKIVDRDLALEDRHHAAGGTEHIAESDRHEFGCARYSARL